MLLVCAECDHYSIDVHLPKELIAQGYRATLVVAWNARGARYHITDEYGTTHQVTIVKD